jgi:hypothetical protein
MFVLEIFIACGNPKGVGSVLAIFQVINMLKTRWKSNEDFASKN